MPRPHTETLRTTGGPFSGVRATAHLPLSAHASLLAAMTLLGAGAMGAASIYDFTMDSIVGPAVPSATFKGVAGGQRGEPLRLHSTVHLAGSDLPRRDVPHVLQDIGAGCGQGASISVLDSDERRDRPEATVVIEKALA